MKYHINSCHCKIFNTSGHLNLGVIAEKPRQAIASYIVVLKEDRWFIEKDNNQEVLLLTNFPTLEEAVNSVIGDIKKTRKLILDTGEDLL